MDMRAVPAGRRFVGEWVTTSVIALLWLACLVLGVGGPRATQAISNFGLIAAAASAGLACLATARRGTGEQERMWRLLGISALSWGCGQAAWTWYETVLGREVPFPSLADVGYLAAVPLAAGALLSLPFAAYNAAGRVRQVLDGLLIAASLLLVSWVLVLNTLFQAGADNGMSQAISLAYPIGDIVVGTIVVFMLTRARGTNDASEIPLPLIGAGLVAWAVADSGFVYLTAVGSYSSGALIDAGWFLGYLLILIAARKSAAHPAGRDTAGPAAERMDKPVGGDQLGLLLRTSPWWGRWWSPPWPRSSTAGWGRSPAGSGRSSCWP